MLGKGVDGIGYDAEFAGGGGLENIAIWAKGQPLLPRPVARREVRFELKVFAGIASYQRLKLLENGIGLVLAAFGHRVLHVKNLCPNNSAECGGVQVRV